MVLAISLHRRIPLFHQASCGKVNCAISLHRRILLFHQASCGKVNCARRVLLFRRDQQPEIGSSTGTIPSFTVGRYLHSIIIYPFIPSMQKW